MRTDMMSKTNDHMNNKYKSFNGSIGDLVKMVEKETENRPELKRV